MGLSSRNGGSSNTGMRQPRHARSPEGEDPQGPVQALLAVGLPLTRALGVSMSSRCRPRLRPPPIADPIA